MAVKNNKVVLGMSGGVDSTASAFLLKKRGFEVHGLYFDVFGEKSEGWEKALRAAEKLEISIEYRDVSRQFRQKIISAFYNDYVSGRTPNPCVICNREIKFRVLEEEADRIGAYYIATGHYARVCHGDGETTENPEKKSPDSDKVQNEKQWDSDECRSSENSFISRAANSRKDQSYVLWRLEPDTIKRIIFPLSEFTSKEEIRDMLRNQGFDCAEDRDSQEICFIPDNDYVSFLTEKMGLIPAEGDFVDGEGQIVGRHRGIIRYTVGQRKGLGITFGKPTFVTEIDAKNNRVFLGNNEELFKTRVISDINNFQIGSAADYKGRILKGKVRYSATAAECMIEVKESRENAGNSENTENLVTAENSVNIVNNGSSGNRRKSGNFVSDRNPVNSVNSGSFLITTIFSEPQRAVTPGQSIVWYDGDRLVGGGIIVRGEK